MIYQPDLEYIPGSSDNPRRGVAAGRRTFERVEELLKQIPLPISVGGELDVIASNAAVRKYLENWLNPVVREHDLRRYRVLKIDEKGLLKVEYTPNMPQVIEPISPAETIDYETAKAILGMKSKDIKALISEGRIRGSNNLANLCEVYLVQSVS